MIRSISAATAYALLLTGGCAQHSKPPLPPLILENATAVKTSEFLGSPLSGALLQAPPPVDPDEALAIDVSFIALERMPSGIGSLDSQARLIIATHGASPVRSTGMLTRLAGYATGDDAENFAGSIAVGGVGRSVPVGHATGALPDGATARFEIADSNKTGSLPSPGIGHRRFQVQLSRPNPHLFTSATRPATLPATGPTSTTAPAPEPALSEEPPDVPRTAATSPVVSTSLPATAPAKAIASA
ncbi:MAG TPA: hypothetical protein VFC46_02430, partial [Humisphaera sp.]|nr:hypothetical protein [Humisphaera sp.]